MEARHGDSADGKLVKVGFPLAEVDVDQAYKSESLWAARVLDDLYEIRNVPFFVKGLSFGDTVKADIDPRTGNLQFGGVVKRSGWSTFRLRVSGGPENQKDAKQLIGTLLGLGCGVETANDGLVALNVPPLPADDMNVIIGILSGAAEEGIWHVEEAHNASKH